VRGVADRILQFAIAPYKLDWACAHRSLFGGPATLAATRIRRSAILIFHHSPSWGLAMPPLLFVGQIWDAKQAERRQRSRMAAPVSTTCLVSSAVIGRGFLHLFFFPRMPRPVAICSRTIAEGGTAASSLFCAF